MIRAEKPPLHLTLEHAAEIAYGVSKSPWTAYCYSCEETYLIEDMLEEVEPHGEITLLCPKGHHEVG